MPAESVCLALAALAALAIGAGAVTCHKCNVADLAADGPCQAGSCTGAFCITTTEADGSPPSAMFDCSDGALTAGQCDTVEGVKQCACDATNHCNTAQAKKNTAAPRAARGAAALSLIGAALLAGRH